MVNGDPEKSGFYQLLCRNQQKVLRYALSLVWPSGWRSSSALKIKGQALYVGIPESVAAYLEQIESLDKEIGPAGRGRKTAG